MEDKIVEFVGKVSIWFAKVSFVAAPAAATAWLIFRFLGKKWIENKFQKSLEDHKYKHDKEIQRLRGKIDSLLSRVTKIHEKEFDILSQAWVKLDTLLDTVLQFIRETHNIPKLDDKSLLELEKFLSEQCFTEIAKQNIRNSKFKGNNYFYEKSKKASDACLDFQDYISKNAIFLSSDIKNKFKEAEYTIRTAWAIRDTAEQSKEKERHLEIKKACDIVAKKIPPIKNEIEELVQKRLCFHEA